MSIFNIFRTKKPIDQNEPELVGRTSNVDRAFEIADQFNKSEIKTAQAPDQNGAQGVQGNRMITEVFTNEELREAYAAGQAMLDEQYARTKGDLPA